MIFKHAVPILYSSDVTRSLTYYTEILGFESKWEWDNPPTFGGVSKDSVEIFFCKYGQGSPGTWISVFMDDVDTFYEEVKARDAKIVAPPQDMEWGIREMLVEDPDGHMIRFGQGSSVSDRVRIATELPKSVRIISRVPTAKELNQLAAAIGWASPEDKITKEIDEAAIEYAVVAEDTESGNAIGCAFLLGDRTGFYYVRNVIVHPDWQCKRVGSAIMQALNDWLDTNAPPNGSAWLHTGERLARFYRQFGFRPAFGMFRQIRGDKK
jgi:catechol 2,3-dioxygenase-like lactoylglutathione lyase family enzyme/GNAT superfamily N-acetyltransferase